MEGVERRRHHRRCRLHKKQSQPQRPRARWRRPLQPLRLVNMACDKIARDAMRRDLAMYVGMQIKLRRTQLNLTLRDVSEMVGVTPAALSKIERGETDVKLSTLALLRSALALNIEVSALAR